LGWYPANAGPLKETVAPHHAGHGAPKK